MEEIAFFAKQYLEDILSFFGLKIDVAVDMEENLILLDVPSTHLNGFLIGSRSETLKAFHVLVFVAVQQQSSQPYRVNIDIANYKKQRAQHLARRAQAWIKEVKQDGGDKKLEPMNAADRRVIHQLASEHGLTTESIGEGLGRHIILKTNSGATK